jgi:hypothetical protein
MGKAADEFQAYLFRQNGLDDAEYDGTRHGRVNHSSAGAAFAQKNLALKPDLFTPILPPVTMPDCRIIFLRIRAGLHCKFDFRKVEKILTASTALRMK